MRKLNRRGAGLGGVSAWAQLVCIQWTLILTFLCTLTFAQWPFPPSSTLLYGNVFASSSLSEEHILGQCTGEPVYIDYSEAFNSAVVVSNDNNRAVICISPLNSTSAKAKLKVPKMSLPISPHTSYYSMDWARGLLYIASEQAIFVQDLKSMNSNAELQIYRSNRSITIKGLVTLPDQNTLMWLEYDNSIRETHLMQSQQDGKDIKPIGTISKNLDFLYYDYASDHFLVLEPKIDKFRSGFLFKLPLLHESLIELKNLTKKFNLSYYDHQVNNVILYDHNLVFIAFSMKNSQFMNASILCATFPSHEQVYELDDAVVLRHLPLQTEVLAVMSDKLRPTVPNYCPQNLCKQPQDYCIPHNQSTYICQSNPSRVFIFDDFLKKEEEEAHRSKMIILGVIGVLCFTIVLIVVCALLLTKKKLGFYQIRLRNINRINSAKLEPKTEATEEIAE